MKEAIDLIIKERQRQIDVYGYTDEHIQNNSDDYDEGQLSDAAASYAMDDSLRDYEAFKDGTPYIFPWDIQYWKPSPENRIKELTKAGAMIVAEITRLLNPDN